MSVQLCNKNICLEIGDPGVEYKGSRFDWSGHIRQITYLGKHTFCTDEILNNPKGNLFGCGLSNEFGIDYALGYENCPVGDKFHKIGIGLLTRKSIEGYNFFDKYEVEPYSFSCSVQKGSVHYSCSSQNLGGYNFQINKTIQLNGDSFSIFYSLTNRCEKTITTNEYVHNFLNIDNCAIDKNYSIQFPCDINPNEFGVFVDPENVLNIKGSTISWNIRPEKEFFIGDVFPGYEGKFSWTLIHHKQKIGIIESTDFNIQKVNLWGKGHTVSPEIFIEISIEPGQTTSWSRKYEVFEA